MSTRRVRRTSLVLTAFLIVTVIAATAAVAQGRADAGSRDEDGARDRVATGRRRRSRISTGDVIKWRGSAGRTR